MTFERTYGGASDDFSGSVQQTTDEGYIIAGWTESFGASGDDVYLIKTDGNGATFWTKTYGGTDDDSGNPVQQTRDEGYIIAGSTKSFGAGWSSVYLIKTNSSGTVVGVKESSDFTLPKGFYLSQNYP